MQRRFGALGRQNAHGALAIRLFLYGAERLSCVRRADRRRNELPWASPEACDAQTKRAALCSAALIVPDGVPTGIRTPVASVKGSGKAFGSVPKSSPKCELTR